LFLLNAVLFLQHKFLSRVEETQYFLLSLFISTFLSLYNHDQETLGSRKKRYNKVTINKLKRFCFVFHPVTTGQNFNLSEVLVSQIHPRRWCFIWLFRTPPCVPLRLALMQGLATFPSKRDPPSRAWRAAGDVRMPLDSTSVDGA